MNVTLRLSRLTLSALLATVVMLLASTGLASAKPASIGTPGSIYWGAVTGTQFGGVQAPFDMSPVADFAKEDSAGKRLSIIPWYEPFTNCASGKCVNYAFPTAAFTNVRDYGAIPMVSWATASLQDGTGTLPHDRNFTLKAIARGKYDRYITSWARTAKAWGHPFFLRLDWEMNGNWFVWGNGTNTNTAANFVAAWRHIHNIFTRVGATNATWVWCPNDGNAHGSIANLDSFYPGNAYVDWTCLDGYNFGTSNAGFWTPWNQLVTSSYDAITKVIAPGKPMMIGEFNSDNDGGSQALWLAQALAEIPTEYPDIHAAILYDTAQWEIEKDPAAQLAFKAGIGNPAYLTNGYANLNTSPIPVP